MAQKYQLVRGMRDIGPEMTPRWREVERIIIDVVNRYGYQEVRLPLLESTDLFARGVGESTDIVSKEMFSLDDRKGRSLTLRPEGTASCVRMCIENGLLRNQAQRLWYQGSMFRYEKPQKGRTREFNQIGCEVFGLPGPDVDAELIDLLWTVYRELGIADLVTLEINTIGSGVARQAYRDVLVDYLTPFRDELDGDSQRRLETNPMRILDSKIASTRAILENAPRLEEYVDEDAMRHFEGLRRILDGAQIPYRVNPRLVRGLDYYTHTVFEWVTDDLGAQSAVCAGGRYDGLVEKLGGKSVPGAGFGLGLDRTVLLHEARAARDYRQADVYCVVGSDAEIVEATAVSNAIRQRLGLAVVQHAGGGSLKSQLRHADKSGALWAVIVGGDEVAENRVTMKWLRRDNEQLSGPLDLVIERLAAEQPGV